MNKLIAALIAGAFALGSVAAMAQGDKTPPEPVDQAKLKADRAKAKADAAALTPPEKLSTKKAKAAKKQKELAGQESKAMDQPRATPADATAAKAAKGQPKALPDAKAKQDALQNQEKAAVKGGGGN